MRKVTRTRHQNVQQVPVRTMQVQMLQTSVSGRGSDSSLNSKKRARSEIHGCAEDFMCSSSLAYYRQPSDQPYPSEVVSERRPSGPCTFSPRKLHKRSENHWDVWNNIYERAPGRECMRSFGVAPRNWEFSVNEESFLFEGDVARPAAAASAPEHREEAAATASNDELQNIMNQLQKEMSILD